MPSFRILTLILASAVLLGTASRAFSQKSSTVQQIPTTQPAEVALTPPSTRPSAATQPTAATQPPEEDVKALVAALSDDSYSAREEAQAKLLAKGEDAEPIIAAAMKEPLTDEARARLQTVQNTLDDRRAFGPTTITINMVDAPIADVLAEFARQAHADLGINRPDIKQAVAGRKTTVNIDHKNFWEALEIIGDKTGLRPQPWNNEKRMTLSAGGGGAGADWIGGPGDSSGCFRLIAQSCQLVRSLTFAGAGKSSSLTLVLFAVAEPKLHVIGVSEVKAANGTNNWIDECVDDKGNNLLNDANRGVNFVRGNSSWCCQLQAYLKEPANMGQRIARLKGTLRFTVETKSEIIEIDDVLKAKNVTKSIGGTILMLRDVTGQGQQYQVHLEMTGGANANPARWQQLQSVASGAQLQDDKGQALMMNGSGFQSDGNHLTATLNFFRANFNNAQAVGEPKKLVWEVPTETRDITVPFEIKDLPLP